MHRFLIAIIAASGLCLSGTAHSAPANDVECVYNSMTEEDREIGLVLITQSIDPTKDIDPAASAQENEISALLEDAQNACLDLYPWTIGESANAILFARLSLVDEALTRLGKANNVDLTVIKSWHAANAAGWKTLESPSPAISAKLAEHLKSLGWSEQDDSREYFAQAYLDLLFIKEALRRGFKKGVFFR